MRCKACNRPDTDWDPLLEDFYCSECSEVIIETINEMNEDEEVDEEFEGGE